MRPGARLALALAAVLALAVAMAVAGAVVWGVSHDAVRLVVDGPPVELPPLGWPEWLGLTVAGLAVGVVLAVVLPIALLLGLGLPLFGIALMAASVLGAVGLALAGVLLVMAGPPLLLAWWIRRRRARRAAATIGA
jgi:hypothetical protein